MTAVLRVIQKLDIGKPAVLNDGFNLHVSVISINTVSCVRTVVIRTGIFLAEAGSATGLLAAGD